MRLYFVRHGQSEANTRHIISNRERPYGLTPLGRRQAETLAKDLSDVPVTAMFASPLLRARQTAGILSDALGVPFQVTDALREYDCGHLEDRSDEDSWRYHRHYFEEWTLRRHYRSRPAGGESFLDIRKRFVPFIETLLRTCGQDEAHILLVGHGGLFQLMLPLILTDIDQEFVRSHGLGHTDLVVAEQREAGLTCRQWGPIRRE